MLPKINLGLNSVQLFEAQAAVGGKLKEFDEFQKLSERDQVLILEHLRDYSKMLQSYVMNHYHVSEKPKQVEPELPKGRMHEELVKPTTVGYADKTKVLAGFADNFRAAFGREFKKEA